MEKKVDFLIVGAQKSGTSSIYRYLREHPEIQMANKKEVHFFDKEKNFLGISGPDYKRYHAFFQHDDSRIRGECTPIYMYWASAIRRIYEYNPDIKIIASLRNPIDRAYSHWNMERIRKYDDLDFSRAIREETGRCREALPYQHIRYSYIDRGYYSEQIRRIWRFFPKEQTLVFKSSELQKDPDVVLKSIADFLNIGKFPVPIQRKNVHIRKYSTPMSNEDRAYLSNVFSLEIRTLEAMLGWDCTDWLANNRVGNKDKRRLNFSTRSLVNRLESLFRTRSKIW